MQINGTVKETYSLDRRSIGLIHPERIVYSEYPDPRTARRTAHEDVAGPA